MKITDCLDALRDAGWKAPATVCDPIKFRPTGDGDEFGDSLGLTITSREMESILGWALTAWCDECEVKVFQVHRPIRGSWPLEMGVSGYGLAARVRDSAYEDIISNAPSRLEAMIQGVTTLHREGYKLKRGSKS